MHADGVEAELGGVLQLVHELVVHVVRAPGVEQRGVDVDPHRGVLLAEVVRQLRVGHQVEPQELHGGPSRRGRLPFGAGAKATTWAGRCSSAMSPEQGCNSRPHELLRQTADRTSVCTRVLAADRIDAEARQACRARGKIAERSSGAPAMGSDRSDPLGLTPADPGERGVRRPARRCGSCRAHGEPPRPGDQQRLQRRTDQQIGGSRGVSGDVNSGERRVDVGREEKDQSGDGRKARQAARGGQGDAEGECDLQHARQIDDRQPRGHERRQHRGHRLRHEEVRAGREEEDEYDADDAPRARTHLQAQTAQAPDDQQGHGEDRQHDERRGHVATRQGFRFPGIRFRVSGIRSCSP